MFPSSVPHEGSHHLRSQPLLARDRLVQLIDLPYQAQVTTIVAGAGYGKSTLAWQWADRSSKFVRWIALEPVDDELTRFLEKLLSASHLETLDPGQASNRPELLPELASSIDLLTAGMRRFEDDVCVVLDNCHVLTDSRCIDLLNGLLARLPARVSLILIGRRNLPVRLSRLRSQGQVRDITSADLRFTKAEAIAVLELQPAAQVLPEVMDRLWELTDGWMAGFKLATMSQASVDASTDERRLAEEQFLDEYILEEIIEPLPEAQRDLVLAMADLPFVTPGLCEAVLDVKDGHRILARMVRDVPFLIPEANAEQRYRFSPIFAESLHRLVARVSPDRNSSSRTLLAANWLIEEGDLTAAAEFAFRSGDSDIIVHVLNAVCRYHADRSDLGRVISWLDRVPGDLLARSLNMQYWWIVARLGLGRTYGMSDLIDEVEPRWLTSGDPLHAGRAYLCRGMLAFYTGDSHEAERRLSRALKRLPQDALVERLYATTFLGRTAFRRGQEEAAELALAEAPSYSERLPIEEQWSWRVRAPDRANAYALRGDLLSAITKYRLILSELPSFLSQLEGFLRCRLVSPYLERNDLDSAWQAYDAAERLVGSQPDPWHNDLAVAKARLLLASGRTDDAEQWAADYIKRLRRLPEKNQLVLTLAQIWLERREFSLVRSWLADIDALEAPWIRTFGDLNFRLLAIDLDLAEGRVEQAAKTALLLASEAAATLRWSEHIAFSVRAAVALHHKGKFHQSRDVLRPAIDLGLKGGFVRHFQVPGVDTGWLFANVWAESRAYTQLRQSFQHGGAPQFDPPQATLTKREMEVLQLVAMGRSNQQIADVMYISINTVRNHLVNICRRLDASSRSEAVAHGRELGILH